MSVALSFMLDTNIVSDLARHPAGKVAQKIADIGEAGLCISILVAAELRFGLVRFGSPKLVEHVETALRFITTVPFDSPAEREYARIRLTLERAGTPIGPNDLFIAAHACALDVPLVTDNEREFRRVPGLRVENWLR
jgi:tRNA(fMet)-specific endonuclease VapC